MADSGGSLIAFLSAPLSVAADLADRASQGRAVGLPVAAAVEPVPMRLARRCWQWGAPQSIANAASLRSRVWVVAGGYEKLPGDLDPDSGALEQLWREHGDQRFDQAVEGGDLVPEVEDPPGQGLQRDAGGGDRVGGVGGIWAPGAQVRISCIRVRLRTWSRSSSGAEMIWARSICNATRPGLHRGAAHDP
jgi:hypothetical protein